MYGKTFYLRNTINNCVNCKLVLTTKRCQGIYLNVIDIDIDGNYIL